jgi:hypothetical protein
VEVSVINKVNTTVERLYKSCDHNDEQAGDLAVKV